LRALWIFLLVASALPAIAQSSSSSRVELPSIDDPFVSSSEAAVPSSDPPSVPNEFPPAPASSSGPPAPPMPVGPSDAELERAVRAAYNGAAAFAALHGNYFTRDDAFPPVRDAIRTEMLSEGFDAVAVPEAAAASLDAARACLNAVGAELRIVPTMLGDGITLVGVSDARDFVYAYDPHKDAAIKVTPAEPCVKTN
jgi:hypothetical protein